MPRESHGEALLIDRCWSMYLLLTETFSLPSTFHLEFPSLVERALVSHLLHLTLPLTTQYVLYLREEYEVTGHRLQTRSYSYTLTGPGSIPLVRADSLPYHRTDFRKQPLSTFPHHLHDDKGRIQPFTGRLNDFLMLVQRRVSRSD